MGLELLSSLRNKESVADVTDSSLKTTAVGLMEHEHQLTDYLLS